MSHRAQGLYRTETDEAGLRYARLKYGEVEIDVPEMRYRDHGYKPDFDTLLSREEFDSGRPTPSKL